jgi:hypothetical protein
MLDLLLLSLFTFRIANLFSKEDGPWDMFKGLRWLVDDTKFFKNLLDCFKCTSVWVAAGLVACYDPGDWVRMTFVVSAGAMVIKVIYDWFDHAADLQEIMVKSATPPVPTEDS